MKADGGWNYSEACAVVDALDASGLTRQAFISCGAISLIPIDETAETLEAIIQLLRKYRGVIIQGMTEMQERTSDTAEAKARARRDQPLT